MRSGSCSRGVLRVEVSCDTMARSTARSWNASRPTSDSMRRLVDPTDDSPTTLMSPICALEDTCVPAHSSRDHGPPMSTTRTVSPYFSPNRAMAPSCLASSIGMTRVTTRRSSRTAPFAMSSISLRVSGLSAWFHAKSRRM